MEHDPEEGWYTERNDYGDEVDQFGFTRHRCPHCNARMVRAEAGNLLCLNACMLPTWQFRIMQQGLLEAYRKVEADMRAEREEGR